MRLSKIIKNIDNYKGNFKEKGRLLHNATAKAWNGCHFIVFSNLRYIGKRKKYWKQTINTKSRRSFDCD